MRGHPCQRHPSISARNRKCLIRNYLFLNNNTEQFTTTIFTSHFQQILNSVDYSLKTHIENHIAESDKGLTHVAAPCARLFIMSAILSADDLNDFISPGVACIKPVETLPAAKPKPVSSDPVCSAPAQVHKARN